MAHNLHEFFFAILPVNVFIRAIGHSLLRHRVRVDAANLGQKMSLIHLFKRTLERVAESGVR
jgi:hypothetical protein